MAYPSYNPYGQPFQGYQPQQPAYQTGIIWVNDYNEACAYPIAPNTVVPLWDRNTQTVYWKQSDAAGRQGVRILDYKERSSSQEEQKPAAELATKEDLAAVLAEIRGLQTLLKGGTTND